MLYDVVIESFRPEFRAPLIAALVTLQTRAFLNEEGSLKRMGLDAPDYDIRSAARLLERLPAVVARGMNQADAHEAKAKLEQGFLPMDKTWRMPNAGETCCTISLRLVSE